MKYVCAECGWSSPQPARCSEDDTVLELATDPLLGTELARFRLARVIGRGGMGKVYLGVQPEIGSRVAIKILADDVADDPDLLHRFFAEARAVNLIRHENIINILDLDRLPSGRPYIVMEFISGRTLRELVTAGPVPLGGAIEVMIEVLLALDAAHAVGIIHRDLKPDNVIVTETGHAKVLDFGIAKLLRAPSPRTGTGVALGTPQYMAPEQINGNEVDARTDVYAAGCMLFELVTGQRPFERTTDYMLMDAHLHDPIPSVLELRTDLPEQLADVITQALAKRPGDRFSSTRAMARALRQVTSRMSAEELKPLASGAWLAPTAGTSIEMPKRDVTQPTIRPGLTAPTRAERPSGPRVPAPRADAPETAVAASQGRARFFAIGLVGAAIVAISAIAIARRGTGPEPQPEVRPPPIAIGAAPSPAPVPVDAAPDVPDATVTVVAPDAAPTKTAIPTSTPDRRAAKPPMPKAREEVQVKTTPVDAGPDVHSTAVIPSKREPPPSGVPQKIEEAYVGPDQNFDPSGYVAAATKLARKLEPDAQLIRIFGSISGNGFTDLRYGSAVRFELLSAAAAASGVSDRQPCLLVVIHPPKTSVKRLKVSRCRSDKPLAPPRCTFPQIRARIDDSKIPPVSDVSVEYLGGWVVKVLEIKPMGEPWDNAKWPQGKRLVSEQTFPDDC